MDIVTLTLAKKFASKVAAGFSNVVANDETSSIDFTLNDGTKTSLTFPKPKDGVSVEDIYLEGENVYCKFSNEEVKLVGPLPKQPFEISKDPGNGIDMHADGIYMSATGVDLSQEEGNILEAKDDGLYATAPELPDLNTDNITYGEEVLTDVIDDIEIKMFDMAPEWSENTIYNYGDVVQYNKKFYKMINSNPINCLDWTKATSNKYNKKGQWIASDVFGGSFTKTNDELCLIFGTYSNTPFGGDSDFIWLIGPTATSIQTNHGTWSNTPPGRIKFTLMNSEVYVIAGNNGNTFYDQYQSLDLPPGVRIPYTSAWANTTTIQSRAIQALKDVGVYNPDISIKNPSEDPDNWIEYDYITDYIKSKVDIIEGQIEDTRVKKEMKIQQVGGGSIEFHNPKTSSIFEHICNEITNHSELISGNSEVIHDLLDPSFVPDYHAYSLNEQIVGEWIDNSPIYEKTFEIELTHGTGMYLYNIEIYNGNYEIVGIEGILKFPAGGANPLGWLNGDGATVSAFPTATNGVNINTFTVSRNGNKVQLTIKYLKKD